MFGKFAPTSNKVSNGTTLGILGTLISAALVYFIPAWHSGIPSVWQMVIAGGIGALGYFGGGWMSTHKATMSEIQAAVTDAEALMKLLPPHMIQLGPATSTDIISSHPLPPAPPAATP